MISDIERNERLRSLPSGQRLRYTLTLSLVVAGVFVLCIFCAVMLAVIFTTLVTASTLNIDNILVLALPIVVGFIIAISFSANPSKASVPAGMSLSLLSKKAARRGVINGLVVGIAFGFLWALILQLDAVFHGFFGVMIRGNIIAYNTAMLPIALAPTVGLFKSVTSVIDLIVLRAFINRAN